MRTSLSVHSVSNTNLIVSNSIGIAWYTPIVARDGKALAGDYESNPIIEWPQISESKLSTEAPSAEFTILGPSDLFVVERTVDLTVRRDDMKPNKLDLARGNHVLQLDVGTWFQVRPAEPFEEACRKYGQLVYRPTKSDALPFQIPPESDFVKCRAGGPF